MAAGASDRVAERRRAVALARHFREAEGLSIAQIACGAPKPRNAPFGGVFVAAAMASTET